MYAGFRADLHQESGLQRAFRSLRHRTERGEVFQRYPPAAGNVYKVLVDGVSKTDDGMLSGYTEENKLVHFKGDESMIGKIVKVKINESHTYSMMGEVVNG